MTKVLGFVLILIILSRLSLAQVDTTTGITAPKNAAKSYSELSHYLCDGLTGEKEKANAIYNWITHNIKYDVKAAEKGSLKSPKVERVLRDRKGLCSGYAILFTEMCHEAGMKAVVIDGYDKDWIFDNGDQLYIPRHGWCAVLINGNWELADPTWGAGGLVMAPSWWRKMLSKIMKNKVAYSKHLKFKFNYDPQYFMQDPEVFRLKHLPADPVWQLTDTIMPITYFESGDSAVKKFSELYSKPKKNSPDLDRIGNLGEDQRNYELAERAYQYNNKFPVAMAIKSIYGATTEVEKALTDSSVQNPEILIGDAKTTLKKSQEYLKEQKNTISEHYSTLKKKNRTKNQEALQYIRVIKTDDKKLVSQSKKYGHSSVSKYGKIRKKSAMAHKRMQGVSPQKIQEIDPAKLQKKKDAPEMMVLEDSIKERSAQLALLTPRLAAQKTKMAILDAGNNARLESFANNLQESDSLLVKETIARINLHDNYDDEVILLSKKFKEIKYNKVDTLQKYYLVNFDSIVTAYSDLQKLQVLQMDIYKKNLRTMEQYKKWNSYNISIDTQYQESARNYLSSIDTFNADLAEYSGYLKRIKKLFSLLEREGKKQVRLTEYMTKAENFRSKIEKNTLSGRQAFDNKENAKQMATVKKLQSKVQEISGSIN